jgi:hypothetical protein
MHGNVINVLANVIKFNLYYYVDHMMKQQYEYFLNNVLNINHFICQEMFIQTQ